MNEEEAKSIIYQTLKQIAPDTEPSVLEPEQNIRETLSLDSFDTLQFIIALSEKFGFEIPEQDYGKITTIKDLVGYLKEKGNWSE